MKILEYDLTISQTDYLNIVTAEAMRQRRRPWHSPHNG